MRLAGTWIRYSKSAMPHETSAATIHGFAERCFRCPYQAKVMKTLESTSRKAVSPIFIPDAVPTGARTGKGRDAPALATGASSASPRRFRLRREELAIAPEGLSQRSERLAVARFLRQVHRPLGAERQALVHHVEVGELARVLAQ